MKNVSVDPLDASTCSLGEYTHYNGEENRTMTICMSGKGKTQVQQEVDIDAIYCRYICPAPGAEFEKEDFVRLWSNATQWPEGRLPTANENVTIPGPRAWICFCLYTLW